MNDQNDEFMHSLRDELSEGFTETLYQQLLAEDKTMQYIDNLNGHKPLFPARITSPSMRLVAALLLVFVMVGVSIVALNPRGSNFNMAITTEPIMQIEPEPELLYELGAGSASAIAISADGESLIVFGSRGVFRHSLSDLHAEPDLLNEQRTPLLNPDSIRQGEGYVIGIPNEENDRIIALDIATGEMQVRVENTERLFITNGQLSNNGRIYAGIFCADEATPCEQQIMVWDIDAGRLLTQFNIASENRIFWLNPDGSNLAYSPESGLLVSRNLTTGEETPLLSYTGDATREIRAMTYSPDGDYLMTIERGAVLQYLRSYHIEDLPVETDDGDAILHASEQMFNNDVSHIEFLSDTLLIARRHPSSQLSVYQLIPATEGIRLFNFFPGDVHVFNNTTSHVLDTQNDRVLAISSYPGELRVFDATTFTQIDRLARYTNAHSNLGFGSALQPEDGSSPSEGDFQLFARIFPIAMQRWIIADGESTEQLTLSDVPYFLTPDGERIIRLTENSSLLIEDARTGEELARYPRMDNRLISPFISIGFAGDRLFARVSGYDDIFSYNLNDMTAEPLRWSQGRFNELFYYISTQYGVVQTEAGTRWMTLYTVCWPEDAACAREDAYVQAFDEDGTIGLGALMTDNIFSTQGAFMPDSSMILQPRCVQEIADDFLCEESVIDTHDMLAVYEDITTNDVGSLINRDAVTRISTTPQTLEWSVPDGIYSVIIAPGSTVEDALFAVQGVNAMYVLQANLMTGAVRQVAEFEPNRGNVAFNADGTLLALGKSGYIEVWALP